jgi:predicted secreted protein
MAAEAGRDLRIEYASNGSTYTGSFFITSFEATGEQADTITFTLSLESSGAITAS